MLPISSHHTDLIHLQSTGLFSVLVDDVITSIFSYLSLKDLKAMTVVDRFHYTAVKNARLRNINLLTSYKFPPPLSIEESVLNKLDVLAAKIECIPIVGYLCSIPRALGGGLSGIGFLIAEGVSCLRKVNASTPEEREKHAKIQRYSRDQAIRAVYNFGRGLYTSIPIIGEVFAVDGFGVGDCAHVIDVKFDSMREHCIRSITIAVSAVEWMKYTRDHVAPHLPNDSGIDVVGITTASLAQEQKLRQEIEEWTEARNTIVYSNPGHQEWVTKGESKTLPSLKPIFDATTQLADLIEKLKL